MRPGSAERHEALGILVDYHRRESYLNILLSSRLKKSGLDRRQKAMVTELVQGTVRMRASTDYYLDRFSDRELSGLQPELLWSLRMTAYQLLYTSVPDYAACDTGVQLVADLLGRPAASYVNAVLRSMVSGIDAVEYPDASTDPSGYIEARFSHPRWLADMWVEEMGFERTVSICEADNLPRPVSLRCNTHRVEPGLLAGMLESEGFEVTRGEIAEECLLVKKGGAVSESPSFQRGLFSVQDQGSIMVGRNCMVEPGMRVLDMCAAPGGKSNHLAEMMMNSGEVVSVDINRSRLELVEREAYRLGNSSIRTICDDATSLEALGGERFDRVLLDAPCSGLGTLGRRPDVRWRKAAEDIGRLAELQSKLISRAALAVETGGLLVYSTCTISGRENQEVVARFLEETGGFEPAGSARPEKTDGVRGSVQLLPDEGLYDGVFVAVMRKG